MPRFARNDTSPSVIARHTSAEAISHPPGLPRFAPMTEKASATNRMNEHWVFTFVVGFHYYIWNESKMGDIILGWGLEIAMPSARNDREKTLP